MNLDIHAELVDRRRPWLWFAIRISGLFAIPGTALHSYFAELPPPETPTVEAPDGE